MEFFNDAYCHFAKDRLLKNSGIGIFVLVNIYLQK